MSLDRAYALAGVNKPLALHEAYCELEQPIFVSREWDYNNPYQLHNWIKEELEDINFSKLSEEECVWCREILWFWYHHAISCAIWKNDRVAAQVYSMGALYYQEDGHPNQITRLLYYIAHDRLDEAKAWAANITDEDEGPTAIDIISWYEQGLFLGPPE